MIGAYRITVANATGKYEFTIRRNITIIKGDSASGKTILVNMIRDYVLNGPDSGVSLSCAIPCRVIDGNTWEDQLATISDSIVFIDEGNPFISSTDFASYVKAGNNYYVLVTREKLVNLPYSVEEIYGIKSSGKYNSLEPVYHEMYHIYEEYTCDLPAGEQLKPDIIITEDSNAGYDFFQTALETIHSNLTCTTAGGKSKLFRTASSADNLSILIFADGAAFGCEMERICELRESGIDLHLYLPESFEWLILDSGVIKDVPRDEIDHAENHADSRLFFSWERYFTDLLTQRTRDTHMAYSKTHLNDYYRHSNIINRILDHIHGIDFGKSED